jgi:hypothetical protein
LQNIFVAIQSLIKTRSYAIIVFLVLFSKCISGQGRVVINEFMAWSGCNTTSEFIELLNFGPGPMDIGCYIVTNGTYSVTIPPNTVLQPGQYFVLSGQNTIAQGCGNTDSLIHVDLNWTTCNCTNTAIPTTGDGFMQNGGSANEKVILLDPNMSVMDAVSRNNPVSSSVSITTATLNGACSPHNFDLDNMAISYETIGNSTGVDNSFARKVDGDCGWVKTTAISARAPNKTGSSASASYGFNTISASDCQSTAGTVSIQVSAADVNALFPMNYTLAFDADANNTFTDADSYLYGVDNTAPSIDVNNLAYGRYRITVGSSLGCNLKNFDFFIFNCYGIVLPVRLLYFKYDGIKNNQHSFIYRVEDVGNLKEVVLEGGEDGIFQPVQTQYNFTDKERTIQSALSSFKVYRLRLKDKLDKISYSQVVTVTLNSPGDVHYWPNPVNDKIFVEVTSTEKTEATYTIINSNGSKIRETRLTLYAGDQVVTIPVEDINRGVYQLRITGNTIKKPVQFRFIKQ